MKIIRVATYAVIFMLPFMAYASDVIPTPEVISANAGLFQWVLGGSILLSLYLLSRQIKASETNNDLQWKAINSMNLAFKTMHDEFLVLKTEHKIHHDKE